MSNLFFKGTRETILLPVTAECPTDNGTTKVNFKVRYRVPTLQEAKDWRKELVEEREGVPELIVAALIKGWSDVLDANDQQIEFNEENLSAAMAFIPYYEAICKGALQMVFGKKAMEEARQKNSSKRGATG